MAINIVSSNLNQIGNAGNFETDPSSWGFTPFDATVTRSLEQAKKNLYSCKFECLSETFFPQFFIASGRATVTVGKKYIIKAWVYVPTANKLAASDTDEFIISSQGSTTYTVLSSTAQSQTSALNTWVEVTLQIQITGGATTFYPQLTLDLADEDPVNNTGICYVDQFEIFEYEDVVEVCTVAINVGASVVTNETVASANDGTITVSASASGSVEYSINSGSSWQSSNLFSGLAPGTYVVLVREVANTSCTANTVFTVQAAAPAFTATVATTNETILGNNDGSIEVTPAGGTGPYQYSKDGGSNYQSGNTFSGLQPGVYGLAIKDATDAVIYESASIAQGVATYAGLRFIKNPMPFELSETANKTEDNYRIYCEVLVEDVPGSGTYNKKLAMELKPESTGISTFYLQQAFAGLIKPTPPTKGVNTIREITARALLYKVGYGDLFDPHTTPQGYQVSNVFQAVYGGINKKQYPTLDYLGSYISTNKKFLSWRPTERLIDATQEEYLTFFNYDPDLTSIKLWAKAWYTDGTDSGNFDTGIAKNTAYARHYEIPAGSSFNNVALEVPAKTILRYELWLQDAAANVITEKITFNVNQFKKRNTRYFMYLNSLGAFEVVRLTGAGAEEMEFNKETMQGFLGHSYNADTTPELESFNTNMQRSWKLSTGLYEGPQGLAYIRSLADLQLSNQVYEYTSSGWQRRVILPETVRVSEDFSSKYAMRFTAVEPFIENVYTPNV